MTRLKISDYQNGEFNPTKIGIIGGGQLGLMLALKAAELAIETHIFTPDDKSPALRFCPNHVIANYDDDNALQKFASNVDVITYEFENLPLANIKKIEKKHRLLPDSKVLAITQDRNLEKKFIQSLGLQTAPFIAPVKKTGIEQIEQKIKLPAIAKTRKLGYDGKGQTKIANRQQLKEYLQKNDAEKIIIEQKIDFIMEVSIIIARDQLGNSKAFPITRNRHKNGILIASQAPANLPPEITKKIKEAAKKICLTLDYIGVMAIEFFIVKNDAKIDFIINELAPRVHNSGHWTQNGCDFCQFMQHIRCICGLKIHQPKCEKSGMINLLGDDCDKIGKYISSKKRYHIHSYSKERRRNGRKMAHVNWVDK